MIGIGIDHDVTIAAIKAIRDAMDRNACFSDYDKLCTQKQRKLHIQLGVPSAPTPVRQHEQSKSSSSVLSVVSPSRDSDGDMTSTGANDDQNNRSSEIFDVIRVLKRLFPKACSQLLHPIVHVQEGGLRVPSTKMHHQEEKEVNAFPFSPRDETYVVVASLSFLFIEYRLEQKEQICYVPPHTPELKSFLPQEQATWQGTMLQEKMNVSVIHDSCQSNINKNDSRLCSQTDDLSATKYETSSTIIGSNKSAKILSGCNFERSTGSIKYANSARNPIIAWKEAALPDEHDVVQQVQKPKRSSLSSIDLLAHISVAILDEEQQDVDDDHTHDQQQEDRTSLALMNTSDYFRPSLPDNKNNADFKTLSPGKTPKNHIRHFVRHTYRDYSREIPPAMKEEDRTTLTCSAPLQTTPNAAFPIKLHETLSQIANDGYDHVVGWLSHGRSFKIHRQNEFVETIMPQYFVMTKKSSFLRQLNLYGFRRISDGSYYHERFLRGMKYLCNPMSRLKVNGNRIRAAGNPNEEPVFFQYPTCPPTERCRSLTTKSLESDIGVSEGVPTLTSQLPVARNLNENMNSIRLQVIRESGSSGDDDRAACSNSLHSSEEGIDDDATVASSSSSTNLATTSNNHFIVSPLSEQEQITTAVEDQNLSLYETDVGSSHRRKISFPLKLQRILDQCERDRQCDVFSWLPHGRAFIVHDTDRFVREVLPLHFNQTKYSSFQRQCHMYHMIRITHGVDKGAYYHHQLQRGQPHLSIQMLRTRVNGNGTRRPSNPNQEPNLYVLPPLPAIELKAEP
jgi:HSF-type DNA-binding